MKFTHNSAGLHDTCAYLGRRNHPEGSPVRDCRWRNFLHFTDSPATSLMGLPTWQFVFAISAIAGLPTAGS